MISAHLTIDPHFIVGPINRRLFGSFVEHLGRCVYDGIYEPGHPDGRRGRLPHRRDRAGPRARRLDHPLPRRQLRLGLPLGGRRRPARGPAAPPRPRLALHRDQRGGPRRVRALADEGRQRADVRRQPRHPRRAGGARRARVRQHPRRAPTLSDQRIANGASSRYDIRMWCLGNEMDGPWQLGHGTAERLRPARVQDRAARCGSSIPTLELVVCGSSSAQMPTVRDVGAGRARGDLRRRRLHLVPRLLRAASTATTAASWPPRSTWTASSTRSSPPPTTSRRSAAATRRSTSPSTSGTSGTSPATSEVDRITDVERVAGRPAAARGRLLGRRRRRLRQPAHLADPARRPRHRGEPGPAGERDRADHDRAGRTGVAADHVLPVRGDLAARRGVTLELKLEARNVPTPRCTARCLVDAVATHDAETGAPRSSW